jgi:hypothetical protein
MFSFTNPPLKIFYPVEFSAGDRFLPTFHRVVPNLQMSSKFKILKP